jgi:hypothetical protein
MLRMDHSYQFLFPLLLESLQNLINYSNENIKRITYLFLYPNISNLYISNLLAMIEEAIAWA